MVKDLINLQPIKFLNGGVVMKAVAFALNYLLADYFQLDPSRVYIFVLLVDFLFGYFINRFYVFEVTKDQSHKKTFFNFVIAGLSFRGLNWLIYVGILKFIDVYILIAQLIATVFVLVLKYFVYKKVFS